MNRSPLRNLALALPLVLLGFAGCKSSIDDKAKAKVEDAEKAEQAEQAEQADDGADAGDAKTFALATDSSKVSFVGAKQIGEHTGSFSAFSGTATVAGGKLTAMEIVVDMDSVTTDAEDLTKHLKAADFFEVETYPESKFTLLSVEDKAGADGATHEVAGNLEMKGQAKKVTFPATIVISDAGIEAKADFAIDRKLWGIDHPGQADNLIKDEVGLTLELQFK